MEKANIFLVEDDRGLVKALKSFFSLFEFTLVLWAKNREEALEFIKSGELERKGVNIAIIDGYFPDDKEDYGERFNGPEVAEFLREKSPNIKIISFSSAPGCSYGDFNVKKIGGHKELVETIKSIVG